ncbi:Cro/CI family transcriptional regulator [Psychromonas hadalis]|uniref:Cro/CI family transcriptional regulator n=1 Tax=Psychromonas hadalis TaxID=211669 RepID=UPI0003B7B7C1|nr:Cro/CI family transcriptional regulator [Psychromonas hadalis]
MKKQDAIKYFGGVGKVASELGIAHNAVSQWGEEVPIRRAFELERITNGALKADFTAPVPKKLSATAKG